MLVNTALTTALAGVAAATPGLSQSKQVHLKIQTVTKDSSEGPVNCQCLVPFHTGAGTNVIGAVADVSHTPTSYNHGESGHVSVSAGLGTPPTPFGLDVPTYTPEGARLQLSTLVPARMASASVMASSAALSGPFATSRLLPLASKRCCTCSASVAGRPSISPRSVSRSISLPSALATALPQPRHPAYRLPRGLIMSLSIEFSAQIDLFSRTDEYKHYNLIEYLHCLYKNSDVGCVLVAAMLYCIVSRFLRMLFRPRSSPVSVGIIVLVQWLVLVSTLLRVGAAGVVLPLVSCKAS